MKLVKVMYLEMWNQPVDVESINILEVLATSANPYRPVARWMEWSGQITEFPGGSGWHWRYYELFAQVTAVCLKKSTTNL